MNAQYQLFAYYRSTDLFIGEVGEFRCWLHRSGGNNANTPFIAVGRVNCTTSGFQLISDVDFPERARYATADMDPQNGRIRTLWFNVTSADTHCVYGCAIAGNITALSGPVIGIPPSELSMATYKH